MQTFSERHDKKRQNIIRWQQDSGMEEIRPAALNSRSQFHEYGGTSYAVHGNVIWFSHLEEQRLYRMTLEGTPAPITVEDTIKSAVRFAACTPEISRN